MSVLPVFCNAPLGMLPLDHVYLVLIYVNFCTMEILVIEAGPRSVAPGSQTPVLQSGNCSGSIKYCFIQLLKYPHNTLQKVITRNVNTESHLP
jgi:hypothetical protein